MSKNRYNLMIMNCIKTITKKELVTDDIIKFTNIKNKEYIYEVELTEMLSLT